MTQKHGVYARATVILATALLLTACTGNAPPASSGVALGGQPNQDAVALPNGVSAEEVMTAALEQLPELVEQTMQDTGIPGMSVAVVHGGDTVYAEGFGVREAGTDLAVTPDTVFQIASLSKPLSATAVAAAIGHSDGTLDWDTRIHDLLPGFAFSDPLVSEQATIGDAFSHRTGLYTGAGDDLEDIGYDRAETLDRLRLQPLDSFRDTYHYSNFGLTVGAEAVATSRDQSWEDLMDELVFTPIGMTSSSARHDDYLAQQNRALLHAKIDGEFTPRYDRDPDPQAPAGGVSSTANDLAKWMLVLLDDGSTTGADPTAVADPDALRAAMTPQIVSGVGAELTVRPSHYGHGFNASPLLSGRMAYSHSGAFVLGAGTAFQVVPDLDLGIVVLGNGGPVGAPESVIAQFFDLIQFGETTRDWTADFAGFFATQLAPVGDLVGEDPPARPALPDDVQALIGRYENAYFGDLVIEEHGDDLIARIGPEGVTVLELVPWDANRLAYAPNDENAPHGSLASATITREAEGIRITLQSFDERGLGTWTRSR